MALIAAGVSAAIVGPRTETQLRGILDGLGTVLPERIGEALDEVSSVSL